MNWDKVKSSTVPTLQTLSSLGAGSLAKVSNFIKIEILRDFWQIISLFFEGLEDALPDSFNDVIGNFSVSISFCFSCWWNDVDTQKWIGIVVFIAMAIVAIIASVVFFCATSGDPDHKNQGLDVMEWTMRGKGYKKKLKYLLMLLTTLYLPVFRDCVLSLSCDLKFYPKEGDCDSGLFHGMAFLAVLALLVFILPIPIVLYRVVRRNKPVPSLYDAEGAPRVGGYTMADYRADLDDDECPYKVIYDGYERDWAGYKVIVMVIKILLVLPVVLFTSTNSVGDRDGDGDKKLLAIQCIFTIVVLVIYSVLSTKSRPFIKDSDDRVDMISRFTALLIACVGFMASQIDGAETEFGILLNIFTFLGGLVIGFYVISGFKAVQKILKKLGQRVTFTLTRDTGEPLIFSDQLDLGRERKFRIWHEFWDTLIAQDKALRIPLAKDQRTEHEDAEHEEEADGDEEEEYEPKNLAFQYGGSPPFLLDFEGSVGERHAENKEIVEHESFVSFQSILAMAAQPEDAEMAQLMQSMKYIVANLHGLDVFWDGECVDLTGAASDDVEDAKEIANGSNTKFGKMYIVPFPFCAVFLSDDCDAATALFSMAPVIAGKRVAAEKGVQRLTALAARNEDPEVQRRKAVRLRLRALESSMCHWPIQKHKNKTISRQVSETYRDAEGNTKTRTKTERKTVSVLFSFNDGRFGIDRNGTKAVWRDLDVTRGFVANLQYHDGTGSHHEAGWGSTNWNNEPIKVYGADFGLNDRFEETPMFQRFMGQNYSDDLHEAKRQTVIENFERYSAFYRDGFVAKENALSYAFWYYIYNDDTLQREQLVECLKKERNEKLTALAEDGEYLESVGMVYEKLGFFNTDQRHAVWFIFWHDLWMNNMFMPPFVSNEDFLSPFKATSICYRYCDDKADLVQQLEEKGICAKSSMVRKGWVNSEIIDSLYAKMDALSPPNPDGAGKAEHDPKEHHVAVGTVRKSATVRLCADIDIAEEYERASRVMASICDQKEHE